MNHSPLNHRSLWSLDSLSSDDVSALIETALSLKHANEAGRPPQPLRGKNVAVMCESPDDRALHDFTSAATALGARVAHIRPSNSRITQPADTRETASVLGRLYDAIECEGMPLAVVKDVERGAGRPVFNGLAEASHPLRVLGDLVTMREHTGKPLNELTICFMGDASSPTGDAWLQSAALTGLGLCMAGAPAQHPQAARLERARRLAGDTGARLHLCEPRDVRPDAVDFVWNEKENGRCSDGRVQLACTCSDETADCIAPMAGSQEANHLYALQALLCSTVA